MPANSPSFTSTVSAITDAFGDPTRRGIYLMARESKTGVTAAQVAERFGAGAAARNSIGLVLVGGMFVGTLFTLFVVPSLYMLIARDHSHDREREAAVTAADGGIQSSGV